MNDIIKILGKSKKFSEYISEIKKTISPIQISGLSAMGKIQIIEATREYANRNILVITYNEIQARKMMSDLNYFSKNAIYFPKREIAAYDYDTENLDVPYERMETLNQLYELEKGKHDKKIVITTIEAIMQKMISKTDLYKNLIYFQVGNTQSLEEIKHRLLSYGYERTDLVEGKGMYSVRGGILDIGISQTKGLRVEFWGDEIDSIRTFSLNSQRSIAMLNEAYLYPSNEFVLTQSLEEICQKIQKREFYDEGDIEKILNGNYISKIDKYFNCFYEKQSNFLEYINKDFLLVIDDIGKIQARQKNILLDNQQLIDSLIEKERFLPDNILNIEKVDFEESKQNQRVYLEEEDVLQSATHIRNYQNYYFKYRDIHFYKNEISILLKEIQEAKEKKTKIVVLSGNENHGKKIGNLLQQENIIYQYLPTLDESANEWNQSQVIISNGILSSGFRDYENNLLVVTGEEFLAVERKRRKHSDEFSHAEKVVFADLASGDYVVHKHSGIGQYIGVNTITSGGVTKDYIKIKYRNDDILYVPTESLDNVRKYIGGGEKTPTLNRLGGKDWEKTKSKVKSNLREVAKDLIELYAKRRNATGYAFEKDTPWQKQFEDDFPYTETDDQLRCIEEVKKDMEERRPMDRLLCGDVGYGKTEVAIRAAFKAVMSQKQVAYLAPTTILASQQYEEFKNRMENYAIRVELLNRFRTKNQQETIIKKLKLGEVDIVIGTHRILSNDVSFKDLGLLIIDEEHRFGVKDKEKIKKLKENIDVLTMTATPIPRTLHMSIVGIRDMSVIYEPPQNRKPVQTYVLEYDKEVMKEAITKELERKGQVFYLYNNVEQIAKKADEISRMVPEAKVAYAHGQMTGNQIEEIMKKFIDSKIDVLVCTTILESGIDIPNANTIIVENADRLGLAQLYQIRGRVGRADRQAYAYITYRRDKLLSEVADKRLKAIKEFTEFGSGFKIAMRDLEIRGAGSILGEMQHGHMEQVGYDTYCRLLDEVVKEMSGDEVVQEQDIQIDLNLSSYISNNYIEDEKQKIEIYQNIALCRTEEDTEDVIDEITDRFGSMPKEVENLIEIARIKILAQKAGIIKIMQKSNSVVFFMNDKKTIEPDQITLLVKEYGMNIRFSPGVESYITLKTNHSDHIVKDIKSFLKKIS